MDGRRLRRQRRHSQTYDARSTHHSAPSGVKSGHNYSKLKISKESLFLDNNWFLWKPDEFLGHKNIENGNETPFRSIFSKNKKFDG